MTAAVKLLPSWISHMRYGKPSHFLKRRGLSIWIDLDRLDEANKQSRLFSVGRFNLLSFHEKDYGANFHNGRFVMPLNAYVRALAADVLPETPISGIRMLTFPRICGAAFNPLSVYEASDANDKVVMTVYEVSNTFGQKHSYVATHDGNVHPVHQVEKRFYVSPFFPVKGEYQLLTRCHDQDMKVMIGYKIDGKPALLATLRGALTPMTSGNIMKSLLATAQWPMRPLFSIHIEALKLYFKRAKFHSRPEAPETLWSKTRQRIRQEFR
jgi:DUF1365 family protein